MTKSPNQLKAKADDSQLKQQNQTLKNQFQSLVNQRGATGLPPSHQATLKETTLNQMALNNHFYGTETFGAAHLATTFDQTLGPAIPNPVNPDASLPKTSV